MKRVTRDDITKVVGPADDVTIAEIIGTGATADELAEAQAWIVNDEPLLNAGKPLASGRVRELIDILAEFEPSDDDDKETGPAVGSICEFPSPCGRGKQTQFSFRFGIGASNCAISAVCGALPLKVSTLPSTEIAT